MFLPVLLLVFCSCGKEFGIIGRSDPQKKYFIIKAQDDVNAKKSKKVKNWFSHNPRFTAGQKWDVQGRCASSADYGEVTGIVVDSSGYVYLAAG